MLILKCKLYQWHMHRGAEPSAAAMRHIQQCPDCRAAYQAAATLDEALRTQSADKLSAAQHATIQTAILDRLRQCQTAPQQSAQPITHTHRWVRTASIAAAAAMLMLSAYLFISMDHPAAEPVSELAATTLFWDESERIGQHMTQLALLPEQTLQTEMTKLFDNVRRTADFLANCTPTYPTAHFED